MTQDADARTPRVRAVVVNYNGRAVIERCLDHLVRTEWPIDAFEIVVVDNASTDGSADLVADRFPTVRLVRSDTNLGFAGGNNLALADLDHVDYVALVNSDAFVEPGWLPPLVRALESSPHAGAANGRTVFEPRFSRVDMSTEPSEAAKGDDRVRGVRVLDVTWDATDVWPRCEFANGFHGLEHDASGTASRWSHPEASLWVGAPAGAGSPATVTLRLAADRTKTVTLRSEVEAVTATVGPEPSDHTIAVPAPSFDVVNNAGNLLVEGGHGADRGFRTIDEGQFDDPAEVFAWCGNTALLRRAYLEDVGIFDGDFFLYYEDFDLAWRGRLLGWNYLYVPEITNRHVHAASSGEWSALFDHYVQRNRLLTLFRNAPLGLALRQLGAFLWELWKIARREVVGPVVRLRRPHPDFTRRRVRSLLAFLKHLPRVLRSRRALKRRAVVTRRSVLSWAVPQP